MQCCKKDLDPGTVRYCNLPRHGEALGWAAPYVNAEYPFRWKIDESLFWGNTESLRLSFSKVVLLLGRHTVVDKYSIHSKMTPGRKY